MTEPHPWRRYVALGDSFTEGIGDPEPGSPGGHRGWADRVAEVLAGHVEGFSYANLAIRGRLLGQIADEQVEPALALHPDLVSLSAGGNDILRPGADPDRLAERLDGMVARLSSEGATVVLFTGTDVKFSPVFGRLRGKVAIYNEDIRAVAARHDCIVADQWSLTEIQDPRMWDVDRLHLAPLGHHTVARMVLQALAVENDLEPLKPEPLPPRTWSQARAGDIDWARSYFVPWVLRRLRHQSSGDGRTAKRPDASPWTRVDAGS
ncbi:SGNH/GDSL hydrolase family protein [Clavibacter michiganensis]|uniref:SGNH/GDSL hydrolase family protein n=1 Tax=Clavibacter michiganensis TaxID=28447 RepID=UPI0013663310|nr:SGNH/GDSL hydrolase family protein [Clavibacter michiganensis]MDO4017658.1 SGNH/GDSL hydrolase family protein [Clavibacter michiganensis]MDO4036850.1 SGNH/GDSL hydrolase family protein [Clavibacter michiganensis]MDO4050122.1 SGNH/GDSL hydrolase family protein [Clavibacter michiganensis]MDO4061557.1 SGNH/GDSL hydrolase family protein [Clavibacter michiganensis]MDO4084411.1 SGNH/GDSL hydrolase family protein [Clavibacter michiganensis]